MYLVYKITNRINGKIYIGVHKTENVNDSYYGSGKYLKNALKKYGKENFEREIIFIFQNDQKEKAYEKEREIVNEKFLKRSDVYNFKKGGEGGWDHIKKLKNDPLFREKVKINVKKGVNKAFKEGKLVGWIKNSTNPGMLNKKQTNLTKEKISINNGNKLDQIELKNRLSDLGLIERKRGWISKLSKKWNISHTQVRKFIKNIEK